MASVGAMVVTLAERDAAKDYHTVKSLQATLRGMPSNAPIWCALTARCVLYLWRDLPGFVEGTEAAPGSLAGDYAVVLATASD